MQPRPQLYLAAMACATAVLAGCAGHRAPAAPRPTPVAAATKAAGVVVQPRPISRLAPAGPSREPSRDRGRPAAPRTTRGPHPPSHASLTPRHPRRTPTVCDLAHGLWTSGSLPDTLCRNTYR